MDYYLNEYSLRGQFKSIEEFFQSLRESTLPVLQQVQKEEGNVIWKKDTFWKSEIGQGIVLNRIPEKKNERSAEMTRLKIQLRNLFSKGPFWGADDEPIAKIKEYQFDTDFRENFEAINCFQKAVEKEGRILSFVHEEYKRDELPVIIDSDNIEQEFSIDNIYNEVWWEKQSVIKTWRINNRYLIEVRAREIASHAPHFHVTYKECSASFLIEDGTLLVANEESRILDKMKTEIKEWYDRNIEKLKEAWNHLHSEKQI